MARASSMLKVVLAVAVASGIAFSVGCGKKGGAKGEEQKSLLEIKPSELKFGDRLYDNLVQYLSRQTEERGVSEAMHRLHRLVGTGYVVAAETTEDGGWLLTIDVDDPNANPDDAEITLEVPKDWAKGEPPAVGTQVKWAGTLEAPDAWDWADGKLYVDLINGRIKTE